MLASATAARYAARSPQNLANQAFERTSVGEEVTVAAMVAEHDVFARIEGPHDADSHVFLANRGVRGARELAFPVEREEAILDGANAQRELVRGLGIEEGARVGSIVEGGARHW